MQTQEKNTACVEELTHRAACTRGGPCGSVQFEQSRVDTHLLLALLFGGVSGFRRRAAFGDHAWALQMTKPTPFRILWQGAGMRVRGWIMEGVTYSKTAVLVQHKSFSQCRMHTSNAVHWNIEAKIELQNETTNCNPRISTHCTTGRGVWRRKCRGRPDARVFD